jgi:nitronate monooxygenase
MADAIKIPVIASGGIMDGRGIVAALALGASAVQMGTAFLTCVESGVSEGYRKAICDAAEDETQITRAFSGRPARGIVNRFLDEMENKEDAILPFPVQNAVTRPMRNESARQDNSEYLSLWAGQGVRLARRTSTAELIMRLSEEIRTAIAELSD